MTSCRIRKASHRVLVKDSNLEFGGAYKGADSVLTPLLPIKMEPISDHRTMKNIVFVTKD